jgi:hypothetical protein
MKNTKKVILLGNHAKFEEWESCSQEKEVGWDSKILGLKSILLT